MFLLNYSDLIKKLLKYYFKYPKRKHYIRELSSIIGHDQGNISREIRELEKEGLFKSFYIGHLKFYQLNKRYPLYKELRRIVMYKKRKKQKKEKKVKRKGRTLLRIGKKGRRARKRRK